MEKNKEKMVKEKSKFPKRNKYPNRIWKVNEQK